MNSEIAELEANLARKLKYLCSIHDQPAFFVSEYFFGVRNSIDFDAETFLQEQACDEASSKKTRMAVEKTKRLRAQYIEALKEIEDKIISQMPVQAASSSEVYASLIRRVEEFKTAPVDDIDAREDAYVKLALEIVDETNQMLKRISGNQTVVYISADDQRRLGTLIHLRDEFLTSQEILLLKSKEIKWCSLMDINEGLHKVLNGTMAVETCRPLILTRSQLILMWLFQVQRHSDMSESYFISFGASTKAEFGFSITNMLAESFVRDQYRSIVHEGFQNSNIEGLDDENPFEHFHPWLKNLNLEQNRLRRFRPRLLPAQANILDELDLSYNQLQLVDEDLLAKCVNLRSLRMCDACLPGVQFSIGFLASLSTLRKLELTLPESPVDFGVFKHLVNLESLQLFGAAAATAGTAGDSRLTDEVFEKLSAARKLTRLALTYFDVETIGKDALKGFSFLHHLDLSFNRIKHVHEEVLKNCPSSLDIAHILLEGNQIAQLPVGLLSHQFHTKEINFSFNNICQLDEKCFKSLYWLGTLTLSNNRIDELPLGVFNSLTLLEELSLDRNNIRRIRSGTFSKSIPLDRLHLNDNPIEEIEANAFGGLKKLSHLSLNNCKLKAINNTMFRGLTGLSSLGLARNQIESIQVITEYNETKRMTESSNLTPEELDLVVKHLFVELTYLSELFLGGNKLDKLDLNIFHNLTYLSNLDLSCNQIAELNTEVIEGNLKYLTGLNLANNRLVYIDESAFSESTMLERLNVSNNKLESLADDFFEPFEYLVSLDLHNNNLTMRITSQTFARSDYEEINLLDNKSVSVEDNVFSSQMFLRSLKLDLTASFDGLPANYSEDSRTLDSDSDSYSSTIDEEQRFKTIKLAKSNPNTLRLFVSNDKNQAAFQGVYTLSIINSSLSTLSGLDLGIRFATLIELDLSKNQLTTIEPAWFENLDALEVLNLSGNEIESLNEPEMFKSVSGLYEIDLSANKLKHVHRHLFKGLYQLVALDLSNNQLGNSGLGFVRGLLNLSEFDLSNNSIASLNLSRLFESCRQLRVLKASHNQLDHRSVNEVSMAEACGLKELHLDHNLLENLDFARRLPRTLRLEASFNKIDQAVIDDFNRACQRPTHVFGKPY